MLGDQRGKEEAKRGIRKHPEGCGEHPDVFRKADRLPRRIENIFPEKIGKTRSPLSCTTQCGLG
jgi:hypothetical protein